MQKDQPKKRKGKKRGPQPGVKYKHAAYSLIVKAGELPQKRRYIEKYLTESREGWIRDIGPTEEDLTTSQRVMIDKATSLLGVTRCIEEYIKETGVLQGTNLQPILLKAYLSYVNSLRLILRELGIEQKQADAPDIQQVMREFDEQKAKDQGKRAESDSKALSKAGQGVDKGGREK